MDFPPQIGAFRRPRRTFAAALALAALGLPGCGEGDGGKSFERPPPVVEVVEVESEPLTDVATFSGQLDAEYSVLIRPEIEGMVRSVEFDQGHTVEQGDVLFRLDAREQAARLREAEANRDLMRQRWNRAQQLLTRDASSAAQADVAKAEYEIAQARVDLARLELDRTEIRAPFDGVLGLRLVDVGARVDDETDLVRIDAVDRLQVTFAITDVALPFARTGMKVEAWVRPYPGVRFPGEVFFVSPSLDPRNRRILVKAWIDNADRRLAPGLFANVDLQIRQLPSALVVPESAVAIDQRGSYVWVIEDDLSASRRPIETGLRERGVVEVVEGLAPGLRIVSAGTHKVVEGDKVRISEEPLGRVSEAPPPEGSLLGEGT
jgi:membrane fusion protein (multidrug efflux system)